MSQLNQEYISQEILNFLEKNILSDGIKLTFTNNLSDFGIDSYSIVEIILFIERKFNVEIPDEHLLPDNFVSIDTIASTVIVCAKQ